MMGEKTSELAGLLKRRIARISQAQIDELIQGAREEAFCEVRAILKEMMIQAILERALGDAKTTSDVPEPAAQGTASDEPPWPADPVEAGAVDSREQIRREMEIIRRRIAENEQLLSQTSASSAPAQIAPQLPVAHADDTSNPQLDEACAYYVYCIVENDGRQNGKGLPEQGIDPTYPVYALPYRGIEAIVSQVSLQEFDQEKLESNLNDIRWLEVKVRAHQDILAAVLTNHVLIPMRFCTIYRSPEGVQDMMVQHYNDLVDTLKRLEGKGEWGVKVYCDDDVLVRWVGEGSDRVKDLQAQAANRSEGAAYFLRKKIEEAVTGEAERVSDECAQHSHDRLSHHAVEAVINSLQSKEITGQEDEMVLNGAYLVGEAQLAAFRAELESLQEEYGPLGFRYEVTGPWPPYNFTAISLEEDAVNASASR